MVRKILVMFLAAAVLVAPYAVGAPHGAQGDQGRYLAGDFHNHSTFSDGATSARTLIDKAVTVYGLDWFVQSGHGGAYSRDGRLDDPQYDGNSTPPGDYWMNTVGPAGLRGDFAGRDPRGNQRMWKWQALQDFLYPITWRASRDVAKPIWAGLEWHMPGHEHCSMTILTGQSPPTGVQGEATALAQFAYLFDYKDNDKSAGAGQGWTGKIPNIPRGQDAGLIMHQKAVAAAAWLHENHRLASYLIPAHVERHSGFSQDRPFGNGWNIEHFRDLNNAAPEVCFGFESQPGHQAATDRGGFGSGAVGGATYGGTGYYCAKIGHLWDALLGEGRHWWLFANSDWHTRGTREFAGNLDSKGSQQDFWPGEYQKNYVWVKNAAKPSPKDVLEGMRRGNGFIVMGDLIDGLRLTAESGGRTATMGETLSAAPGARVTITVRVRDPDGPNHCPYTFDNPSLAQLGLKKPLNLPDLHHVDLIGGEVHGKVAPADPKYTDPTNPTTRLIHTVLKADMRDEGEGWQSFAYSFVAQRSGYVRLRGANLPANTPHETDAQGNPLPDVLAGNITYINAKGEKVKLDGEVEAWADLWFYSNPIFITVAGTGVKSPARP